MFTRINHLLAVIVIVGVPVLVVGARLLNVELAGEILGTFTGGWLLVIQFYFRKAEPKAD